MLNIAVLGAGAWGISLGLTMMRAGHKVIIWSPYDDEIDHINRHHRHPKVLTDVTIASDILFTSTIRDIAAADIVLCVVPTQAMRTVMDVCRPHIKPDAFILCCSKGIETATSTFPTDIVKQQLVNHSSDRIGVLTGPNFAHEVARGQPAKAVIALDNIDNAKKIARQLSHDRFKFLPNNDVRGFELSAAFKNVLAIGSGIIMGRQLGENARAAYLTQGLADLTGLGAKLNCDLRTFNSVGCLGDIMLTCLSTASRNVSFGIKIGACGFYKKSEGTDQPLAEGVHTVSAISVLVHANELKLPSVTFVKQVLDHQQPVDQAYEVLFGHEADFARS